MLVLLAYILTLMHVFLSVSLIRTHGVVWCMHTTFTRMIRKERDISNFELNIELA